MTQNTPKIQLTDGQKEAVDAFFDFLLSDAKFFVLSGGAGVGKTFLMKYISNNLMLKYERSCGLMGITPVNYSLYYTATTNKAAEVLEHSVGQEVSTIHSFLGLRVYDDYKTGKSVITETITSKAFTDSIVFIDESSMIDGQLLDIIKKRFTNSKIVFVGDKAQLAPVGEEFSPVYKEVDTDNFIHLTQSVRNANSPALMNLCSQLRHTVQTGEFYKIQAVPGSIEYLDDLQMQEQLINYFQVPTNSARILCYTNSRVSTYNDYIREIRNLPSEIVEGDELVVARTYARGKTLLNVERELTIMQANPETFKAGFADVAPYGEEIEYREILVQPKNYFQGPMHIQYATDPDAVSHALKNLKRQKDWSRYFELKNNYADLRGKEACTVYKSQGSTYDTVFMDLGNIGTSYDAQQVARMLFVGVSRATTKVFLYGKLPAKYEGNSYYDQSSTQDVAAE